MKELSDKTREVILLNWEGGENMYEVRPNEYSLHLDKDSMIQYIKSEEPNDSDSINRLWWAMYSKNPKQNISFTSDSYYTLYNENEPSIETLDYEWIKVKEDLYTKIERSKHGIYTKNIKWGNNDIVELASIMDKHYCMR